MKFTLPTTALAAILGLALASVPVTVQAATTTATTAAAPAPAKVKKTEYQGVLTAVDTAANTVTIATSKKDPSKTLTLDIATTTTIKKDKAPATLADLAIGEKVSGSYTKDAAGKLTAVKLNYNTPKAAATKAAAAPAAAPVTK